MAEGKVARACQHHIQVKQEEASRKFYCSKAHTDSIKHCQTATTLPSPAT